MAARVKWSIYSVILHPKRDMEERQFGGGANDRLKKRHTVRGDSRRTSPSCPPFISATGQA
eukprot:scaffold2830_cov131-Cylindrotheca_fusiformis.AAC.41